MILDLDSDMRVKKARGVATMGAVAAATVLERGIVMDCNEGPVVTHYALQSLRIQCRAHFLRTAKSRNVDIT